jgi:hypothetical protein
MEYVYNIIYISIHTIASGSLQGKNTYSFFLNTYNIYICMYVVNLIKELKPPISHQFISQIFFVTTVFQGIFFTIGSASKLSRFPVQS